MTNTYKEIKELLELYYEAQTTPEQERQLADYFLSSQQIPDELRQPARLFRAMAAIEYRNGVPTGFEERLIEATCGRESKHNRRKYYFYWASAAAALAIAIAAVRWLPQSVPSGVPEADIQTSEKVLAEVADVNIKTAIDEPVISEKIEVKTVDSQISETKMSPYKEISTPDSAATIVRNLFGKIGKTLACADNAISKPSEIIDNTLTTINTIKK